MSNTLKTLSDINGATEEGKLLIMALAKLSTTSYATSEPDEILADLYKLSNQVDEITEKNKED